MAKTKKCEILVINQIAQVGLERFPGERYAIVKESKDPWAIVVRSQDLHKFDFGPSLRAVGRAGAGVNNIPVPALSKRGIPVFNAPGANVNAVKELVLAGMLLAARNLPPALQWVSQQQAAPDHVRRRLAIVAAHEVELLLRFAARERLPFGGAVRGAVDKAQPVESTDQRRQPDH